jgi:hypothetical protein
MFITNQMGKTISYRNREITTTIRKGKKYWILVEDCFAKPEDEWELLDSLNQAKNLIDFYELNKLNVDGSEEEVLQYV